MRAGDVFLEEGILIREIGFKEMCKRYDDNLLEYDIDDLWDAYSKRGTPWEILKPSGIISVVWPDNLKKDEVVSEGR